LPAHSAFESQQHFGAGSASAWHSPVPAEVHSLGGPHGFVGHPAAGPVDAGHEPATSFTSQQLPSPGALAAQQSESGTVLVMNVTP
jgi:hypothetical protein